jgi:hypothetical protein
MEIEDKILSQPRQSGRQRKSSVRRPLSEVQCSVYHVVRFFVIAFYSLLTIARDAPGGHPWVAIFSSVLGKSW